MTVKHVSPPKPPGLQTAGDVGQTDDPPYTNPADTAHPPDGSELAAAQADPEVPLRARERTGTVDYHAIVARTVAGLVLNNAETRNEVYDHARGVVNQRLMGGGAEMSSRQVAIEQIAFDRAIKRIEAEQRALDPTRHIPPPRSRARIRPARHRPALRRHKLAQPAL